MSVQTNNRLSSSELTRALKPYVHQVTGRSHMLSLNNTTVCKSLLPKELLFYTSITDELRPFVPNLKGVLYAELEDSNADGCYKFSARQVFTKPNLAQLDEEKSKQGHVNGKGDDEHWSDAYQKVLFKGLERFKYDMASGFKRHPWTVDKDSEAVVEYVGANPWSVRQHRREINRMLSLDGKTPDRKPLDFAVDADGKQLQDQLPKCLRGYLMLEDISAGFRHPNVIDFKLGRQIERDDCSEEKKTKHVELAKNSSTGTLMLRLAGMQVYQVNSKHYLCRDKYYGRGLSSSGFQEIIRQFLSNGEQLLLEVIPPIVKKLKELHSVLERQNTYRFYASSLLILYEGDDCLQCNNQQENLICKQGLGNAVSSPSKPREAPRKVEVRMIDFAHSTYKGFNGDKVIHEGPDHDCLDALSNLITILNDILNDSNCNSL